MTNPMNLKLMSSLLNDKTFVNGKASGNVTPLNSGEGNGHFLSDMQKALHASKNDAFHRADKPTKINKTPDNKGYKYYLESFKKELLAQGKPLNKTFLNKSDLSLVKTFLLQCGFSHEKVERFLKDLKANNPDGEINLSQIFLKITELGESKRKEHQYVTLSPATVPYIESILRDINLTPKELDSIFSKARVEGGGLDLHKLVVKLKEIKGRSVLTNQTVVDQISLEDFIASMERIAEKVGKEQKVSPDIKNTLGKILEKVEVSEQKPASASSVKVSSNYHFTESLSSFLKKNADNPNHSGKADLLSNLNKQTELINPVKEKGYRVDTEAGQINVSRNTEAFNFTNTLKTVEHGEKPFRGYFPASLVDQVGKQISRSILRGDQVVTLQLKPPDLGTVRIKIDIKGHTLRLGMIAEHHSIKELLMNNVHELKEALVQHGVKLEKVDVQINHNFGQSLNASKEGADNGRGWRQDLNGEEFHSDNHTEGPHEGHRKILSGSNLLDLVA